MASTDVPSDPATPASALAVDLASEPDAGLVAEPNWEPLSRPKWGMLDFFPGLWLRAGNRIEAPFKTRVRLRLCSWFHRNARDNIVSVAPGFRSRRLLVTITGTNNRLTIAEGVDLTGEIFIVGKGLHVEIGARSDLKDVKIGARGASVRIGADCLFALKVEIRSSDMHRVINLATGKTVNPPRPVEIGNHVWVAGGVNIMRGTKVADDCVVGIGSLVNTKFEEPNCVIAGVPARVVRRNITWKR